jgi:hypothetical protein
MTISTTSSESPPADGEALHDHFFNALKWPDASVESDPDNGAVAVIRISFDELDDAAMHVWNHGTLPARRASIPSSPPAKEAFAEAQALYDKLLAEKEEWFKFLNERGEKSFAERSSSELADLLAYIQHFVPAACHEVLGASVARLRSSATTMDAALLDATFTLTTPGGIPCNLTGRALLTNLFQQEALLAASQPSSPEPDTRAEHGDLCQCTTCILAEVRSSPESPLRCICRAAKHEPYHRFTLGDFTYQCDGFEILVVDPHGRANEARALLAAALSGDKP